MKLKFLKRAVVGVILLATIFPAFRPAPPLAWGFFGHRKINYQAVFTLPPELIVFYKKHIEFITEHAVDPDKRRYASVYEGSRHFMDLDRYGQSPFPDLPRNWTDALMMHTGFYFITEKKDTLPLILAPVREGDSLVQFNPALFSSSPKATSRREFRQFFTRNILPQYYEDNWTITQDSLYKLLDAKGLNCQKAFAVDHFSEHGIVPYILPQMLSRLTNAFQKKDVQKILRLSADIGHYIGDAHVPLHTTENYNGQLTGQDGIHAFWESRLPELFADETYDFWAGRAEFIEDPVEYFWNIVLDSHALVDSVLKVELELRRSFPPDQQECYEMRGNTLIKTQCREFAEAYSKRMGNMVEERMRSSVLSTGSAWYTAWIIAGRPELRSLDSGAVVVKDSADVELDKAVQKGIILGRPHD